MTTTGALAVGAFVFVAFVIPLLSLWREEPWWEAAKITLIVIAFIALNLLLAAVCTGYFDRAPEDIPWVFRDPSPGSDPAKLAAVIAPFLNPITPRTCLIHPSRRRR